jgi:hypothetical protein
MFRRLGSRIAIASALTLAVIGTLAAASTAQATTVGPHQYFVGQVFGNTAQSTIQVVCGGVQASGHPASGQTVEVTQIIPPVTTTVGYTGGLAVEIDAALILPTTPTSGKVPVATFTQYSLKLPIPTSITVPCSGTGVMNFSPYPLDSGTPSNVQVTFVSLPVTPGARSSAPRA